MAPGLLRVFAARCPSSSSCRGPVGSSRRRSPGTTRTSSLTTPSGGRASTAARVFTHFPPVDTYNAEMLPAELAHAARNYAEQGFGTRSLVPFGYGDGGGGPTREMMERARRLADLDGSPRVIVEPPSKFFAAAQAEYPDAPVWSGELYLELHRGTITSQVEIKQGNRRCENLLREAELWSTAALVAGRAAYPYDELEEIWRDVLLNQFHDILPGSSIAMVNDEAMSQPCPAAPAGSTASSTRAIDGAELGPRAVPPLLLPHELAGCRLRRPARRLWPSTPLLMAKWRAARSAPAPWPPLAGPARLTDGSPYWKTTCSGWSSTPTGTLSPCSTCASRT